RDATELADTAAERSADIGGLGGGADRARERLYDGLAEGMRSGKRHGESFRGERVPAERVSAREPGPRGDNRELGVVALGPGSRKCAPGTRVVDYDVVLSNTPPLAFSLRETSAYSDSIWRRSLSPVLASGIDTMRRPLR